MLKNIKEHIYYYYLLFLSFLFPIIPKEFGIIFDFIHLRLVLLLGLIIITLYEIIFLKQKFKKINKLLFLLLIVTSIFMLLGFYNSISKFSFIYTLIKFIIFFLSGYTIVIHNFDQQKIERIFNAIITSSVLSSLLGIYQYITNTNVNLNGIYKYPGSTGRIISTFYNPIYLGIFLLLSLIIVLYKINNKNNKKQNIVYYISFIILFVALLLTYTRTVAVLAAVTIILFVIYTIIKKNTLNFRKYFILLLISSIICLNIPGAKYLYTSTIVSFLPEQTSYNILNFANKYLYLGVDLSVYQFFDDSQYIDASNEDRNEFANIARKVINDYKLTGVGLGNYENFVKENSETYIKDKFGYPHNSYLHLMAEAGLIPGIILIITVILLVLYTGITTMFGESFSGLSAFMILINTLIICFYESLIYDTQLCPLLIIILILLIKTHKNNNSDKEVMFISSVGGHLTQLLELKKLFNEYNYILVTEKTDVTKDMKNKYQMEYLVYGSREYLFTYIFKFTYNVIKSLIIMIKHNPKVIVTTGAHTAVPMCYIGKLFGKKIIFIESYAKRTSPTLSGRLVYPIASVFIVQWESMLEHYPKAKYFGGIY